MLTLIVYPPSSTACEGDLADAGTSQSWPGTEKQSSSSRAIPDADPDVDERGLDSHPGLYYSWTHLNYQAKNSESSS